MAGAVACHNGPVGDYWNHNAAYHPHIVRAVRGRPGEVLDVGCGDGLLLAKLSALARGVTGVDSDPASIGRAQARLAGCRNTRLIAGDFLTAGLPSEAFDWVIFVASLHHMDCAAALTKARDTLKPGGGLIVIGLAAPESFGDLMVDILRAPVTKMMGTLRHEMARTGVPVKPPGESIAQIGTTANRIIPGSRIRRGLYYRYILSWRKPG
jgi:SAM-dependent methyltransferase